MRWVLCFLLLVTACNRKQDQETGSISQEDVHKARTKLSPAAAMHLDSGNAAYRAQNYPLALSHYRAALKIDDHQAAPWFGIYMTQLATGHAAAADSALKKARSLAPGASILRK